MDVSPWSWAAVAVMVAAIGVAWSKKFIATGTLLIANAVIFAIDQISPLPSTIPSWTGQIANDNQFHAVNGDLAFYGPNLAHLHPLGFLQTFTAMFLHGGILHILGNSFFLFAFGLPFEQRIGPRKFLAIYLIGGVVATLVQFAVIPEGHGLGASGAIAAIMGAFAMKYPRLVIPLPVPIFVMMIMLPVPVVVGVGIFLVLNLADVFALHGSLSGSGIGYGAHIGGMVAGGLLALALLRHVRPDGRGADGRVAVDLPKLAPFARDDATKQVLAHMQTNHDEPEVFQAWLDRFFRTATCPTCSTTVRPATRGLVVCGNGHRFDVRKTNGEPGKPA